MTPSTTQTKVPGGESSNNGQHHHHQSSDDNSKSVSATTSLLISEDSSHNNVLKTAHKHQHHPVIQSESPSCLNKRVGEDDEVRGRGGGRSKKKKKRDTAEYGWCSLTPQCVQFMVNRKAFLIVFCVTCVLQGTFHTYFVAVITTLEKLFSIPSQVTGTLMMGSEIGQVSSALLLPYFVGQGHRPRWMAIGSSLFSFATLLCASPHVLIPLSMKLAATQESQYCGANNGTDSTSSPFSGCGSGGGGGEYDASGELKNPHFVLFPIIFLSLLTIGLGQTAVYTLGIPFLDDNVASRDSPIYFSITIGVRILGPVLGFILGSLCTRLYIYPHVTPEYDPTDPRWLGAWWLGMLLISSMLAVTSILMYGFPQSLNKVSPQQQQQQQQLQHNQEISTVEKQVGSRVSASPSNSQSSPSQPKLRNFPSTIKRLLTNKILILRTFSCVFHLLPISGLYTFLPKYLESQFRLAAFQANMVTGIAGILVMGIGIFSSGVFIRRKEPSARGVAVWVAASAAVYAIGMVALMFVGCSVGGDWGGRGELGFNDFSVRHDGDFSLPNCETEKCAKCSNTVYAPVCGADSLVYFSPCHAGCSEHDKIVTKTEREGTVDKVSYTNCSCVGSGSLPDNTATSGMCPVSCDLFPVYLTIFMVIVLVHSTSEVGSMLLTLRCVEPRDKAMALGLIQCAIGIFGNVPCPVIYGTVVDSACIVWGMSGGEEDCDSDDPAAALLPQQEAKRGHCWVYDSSSFRVYFHGTTAFLMFIAFLIDLVVCYYASGINMGTTSGDEEGEGDDVVSRTVVHVANAINDGEADHHSSPLLVKRGEGEGLNNGDVNITTVVAS